MASTDGFLLALPLPAVSTARAAVAGDPGAFDATTRSKTPHVVDDGILSGSTTTNTGNQVVPQQVTHAGYVGDFQSMGFDFYQDMHVLPRSFDFGFVLATQTVDVEVYNAYRRTNQTWQSFVNNAGAGTTLLSQPSLPATVFAQGGIVMQVQVTPLGPAFVNDTLDFLFNVATLMIPIELQRVVLFSVRPEDEYDEELEFFTDVFLHLDGSEQRASPREFPRQLFRFTYFLEDENEEELEFQDERAAIENFLFDRQTGVFGVPVWHEERFLTQAASATDTVIFVDTTDFADFRVGGLVAIIQDRVLFDVAPVASFTSSSITFSSQLLNGHPIGASVFPLRVCYGQARLQGSRQLNRASTIDVRFRVIDNEASIADLSAFGSFNGKLLMDDVFAARSSPERYSRQLTEFNPETGLTYQDSQWDRHKRGGDWRKFVRGRQALWEHRQMIHALRGRQVSWYLPTHRPDLRVVEDLVMSAATISVANVGYTQFVQSRQPKNVIRVTFNNGDPALLRTVVSSSIVDSSKETLTLDGVWPSAYTADEIERIEYVEKVRFDSDRIRIRHSGAGAGKSALFSAPFKAVFN